MDRVIALAGNPNVGKSTVFNALTGMKQHTGNWPGKTVESARGSCRRGAITYQWMDLPGCYSLLAHSEEEEVARDFICFEHPDAVVVVCDATCLERNLNLALQILETTPHVVLCVNLMDEAARKKIRINLDRLSGLLGIPVVGTSARSGKGLEDLVEALERLDTDRSEKRISVRYPALLEQALAILTPHLTPMVKSYPDIRWLALRLLEGNESFLCSMKQRWDVTLKDWPDAEVALHKAKSFLKSHGLYERQVRDMIAEAFIQRAESICRDTVQFEKARYDRRDRQLDRLFTSSLTGFPIMFFLLLMVFWITITGANVPSSLLADGLFWVQDRLVDAAVAVHIPEAVYSPLIFGIYRVLAWVVSVMLPPMAIFFPLFTLLEDFGYLPRVAFNLDRCFQKCSACGKQALTMCMGFGCNAAGVTGCRIIDSPRERLIAIITNNLVPCNGRFPTIIAVISMFLVGSASGLFASFISAFSLALVIILGVLMTLLASKLLSKTILKGMPSSFTLELPPYRTPQIGKVIVRSIFDRTLFVLGRAVVIAAPAGLIIWLMANITVGNATLLTHCTEFLDPFARLLGLDGVILMAFILGMPANEIVVPVMLMAYLSQGSLLEIEDANIMKALLIDNGWNWITAVSVILFSLMHWPCGTACLTIRKETQSVKWMLISILVPTTMGFVSCFLFANAARFLTGIA